MGARIFRRRRLADPVVREPVDLGELPVDTLGEGKRVQPGAEVPQRAEFLRVGRGGSVAGRKIEKPLRRFINTTIRDSKVERKRKGKRSTLRFCEFCEFCGSVYPVFSVDLEG